MLGPYLSMSFVEGFNLGCLAVIFTLVARDFWQHSVARVFLCLLFAVAVYVVRHSFPEGWGWLAGDIMTAIPALIWLLCQMGFTRRPRVFSIWGALALYSFVVPALTRPFGASSEEAGILHLVGWHLPRLSEYVIVLQGMWVILAYWKDDLIESRRQLRAALLITIGIASLWITISMNTGQGGAHSLPFVVAVASLVTAFLLLQGREGVLLGASPEPVKRSSIVALDKEANQYKERDELKTTAAKIEQVMEGHHFYRTEKLTLKMLAEKVAIPEYRTRQVINQFFQYRNFNDYVNQLRIEEACERLVMEPDTPIQNIALDVGYRSLSSFNRAFKEIENQTPTDYRLAKVQQISKSAD